MAASATWLSPLEQKPLFWLSSPKCSSSKAGIITHTDVLQSVFVGLQWEVWGQELEQLYLVEI